MCFESKVYVLGFVLQFYCCYSALMVRVRANIRVSVWSTCRADMLISGYGFDVGLD